MSMNRIILAGHQFCQISIYSAARNKLSPLPDFSTLPPFSPPTLRSEKNLRSCALFEVIKFERKLPPSVEASISRCSSDRKRKIARGKHVSKIFPVITRNWPRNRRASAVQRRTCSWIIKSLPGSVEIRASFFSGLGWCTNVRGAPLC